MNHLRKMMILSVKKTPKKTTEMTYQDLIEELQAYSPKELKQHVTFLHCCELSEVEMDDEVSCEEVESITAYSGKQIVILV